MVNRWGDSGNSDWLYFGGSKITADGDCSHEIKRRLLLGRKVMTNLDSRLKSRDITLPTKIHLVKALVFSSGHVWMWELDDKESWGLKNWCFWTVVLRRLLRVPWTARRSSMSILKESEVTQLCPTLCNLVDCSPRGSSIPGILQARGLEWLAISFSRGSSQPRDWTQVSCIAGRYFTLWATREVKFS